MTATEIGWVACDYSDGNMLVDVRHSQLCPTAEGAAAIDGYEGVRYVHTDGYLYVEEPTNLFEDD